MRLRRDDLNYWSVTRHVFFDSDLHRCIVAVFHLVFDLVLFFLLLDVIRGPGLLITNDKLGLDIKKIRLRIEAEGALALAVYKLHQPKDSYSEVGSMCPQGYRWQLLY